MKTIKGCDRNNEVIHCMKCCVHDKPMGHCFSFNLLENKNKEQKDIYISVCKSIHVDLYLSVSSPNIFACKQRNGGNVKNRRLLILLFHLLFYS